MTNKELKLKILNQVLVDLPKTLEESDRTQQSEYVCDHINNASVELRDYDIGTVLTNYIHGKIGNVFSVFEFLGVCHHDLDGYEKGIRVSNQHAQ